MFVRRTVLAAALATGLLVFGSGSAYAFECANASKNVSAGVQVVIDANTGQVVWATQGLEKRFAKGLVDPDTGEGFHGLVGFDVDGDHVADFATYIVTPNGELPDQAQENGPTCSGVTSLEALMQCPTAAV